MVCELKLLHLNVVGLKHIIELRLRFKLQKAVFGPLELLIQIELPELLCYFKLFKVYFVSFVHFINEVLHIWGEVRPLGGLLLGF